MKRTFIATGSMFAMCFAANAGASPVAFTGSDDHVAIKIPGSRAVMGSATASGDHIEIALDKAVVEQLTSLKLRDATVKEVILTPGPDAYLSIGLRHGNETTRRMVAALSIENTGEGMLLHLPRKSALPARHGEKPLAAAAVAEPQAVVPVAAVANAVAPIAVPTPEPHVARLVVKDAVQQEAASVAARPLLAVATAQPATQAKFPVGAPAASSNRTLLGLGVALALLGLVVAVQKRRTQKTSPLASMEILGQRSLGGKNRVVLMGIGGRELLVAVSENRMSLLDSWSKEIGENLGIDMDPAVDGPAAPASAPTHRNSAAISGILKLRGQKRDAMPSNMSSGNSQDDDMWLRELAAATGEKRPA